MNMESFKQTLLEQRQEILERLERTGKHLRGRDEPISQDFAEQAVEVENNQVVEQLDDEGKLKISQIDQALDKIKRGTFGTCEKCEEDISKERLKAIPYTTLCINCAE